MEGVYVKTHRLVGKQEAKMTIIKEFGMKTKAANPPRHEVSAKATLSLVS